MISKIYPDPLADNVSKADVSLTMEQLMALAKSALVLTLITPFDLAPGRTQIEVFRPLCTTLKLAL